ncbi:MAG: CoA pyrophosphatase [Lewinellaceae bacterium]|nr:CoA pyrophosphatase [Lewinellaceae bacterium]
MELIRKIEQGLQRPLPGQQAQFRMAHAARYDNSPPPPTAKQAAVLALFFPKKSDWHLVLIERESHNENDRHRGQISFPGGRWDDTDTSLAYTALREAEEEVGVNRQAIRLLGPLTELYIPVSNFKVSPFVGFTETTPVFQPQESEVRRILEVPFAEFLNPAVCQKTNIPIAPNLLLRDVPFFAVENQVVWGATAMILSELLAVLEGELPD